MTATPLDLTSQFAEPPNRATAQQSKGEGSRAESSREENAREAAKNDAQFKRIRAVAGFEEKTCKKCGLWLEPPLPEPLKPETDWCLCDFNRVIR
jgi:hypothetical protein